MIPGSTILPAKLPDRSKKLPGMRGLFSGVKASSLFYAIVISIIIAIVSSSLILFAYLGRIEFEDSGIRQRLNLNAGSGLNLLLSRQSLVELNQEKTIDLYGDGSDSVFLSRKTWGAYEIIISKALFKNREVIRIAQVGYYPDSIKSYSLYLSYQDKPLVVCGDTKIKGTAFLPKAEVKRGYLQGKDFTGAIMIDGQIRQSEKILPAFNKDMIDNILSILSKKVIVENDSVIVIEKDLSGDSLNNSFQNRSIIITSANAISISNGLYSGNIVVISDKQILISASAIIKDIIITAPKIIIEKNFKGSMQAFASDSVIVGEDVSLYYPSVLGVVNSDTSDMPAIVLNKNDTLFGNIFSYKKDGDKLKEAEVILEEKSFVAGQVYSNGYADIKGTIYGSLMSYKLIFSNGSGKAVNHLLNAVIDQTALSKHYVGINLVEESTVKKIVKWLN